MSNQNDSVPQGCLVGLPSYGQICEYVEHAYARRCKVYAHVMRFDQNGVQIKCEVIFENESDFKLVDPRYLML